MITIKNRSLNLTPYIRIFFILFLATAIYGEGFPFPDPQGESSGFKKYLKNFSRTDCAGLWVNRTIIQDSRGIIYCGGEGGIREYDGVSWRVIDVPGNWVKSLAVDNSDTIYVGGINQIGRLQPDQTGSLEYHSLNHFLDGKYRQFSILSIHTTAVGVYFNAGKFLLLKQKNSISLWEPTKGHEFDHSFFCENQLFIWELGLGLKKIKDGKLVSVPGCEKKNIDQICVLFSFEKGSGKLLLGTRSNRLFIYNGEGVTPFKTGAAEYLVKKKLLNGIRLKSGNFALGTFLGGVVILNSSGEIQDIFDENFGLTDNLINHIYEDLQGNLWLALEMGIAKIENTFPISPYGSPPKNIYRVTRHNNRLFIGTRHGLFYLSPGGNIEKSSFVGLAKLFLSIGSDLFVASSSAIYRYRENRFTKIFDEEVASFFQSKHDKKRIWMQTIFTVVSIYRGPNGWIEEYRINKENQFLNTIAEDEDGNIWLGAINRSDLAAVKGVLKITLPEDSGANLSTTRYGQEEGFPSDVSHVFRAAGHVIFTTSKGIYRFDKNTKHFLPDKSLGNQLSATFSKRSIRQLVEDARKNIWVIFYDRTLIQAVYQPDGTYAINETLFQRIPGHIKITEIYPEPADDITWLYSSEHLIRFDAREKKKYNSQYQTLIRKVTVNGMQVYGGSKRWKEIMEFSSKRRNILFEFAAPFFEGESAALYRYLLEESDENWSRWSADKNAFFMDLKPGKYRFQVQTKNVYRQKGRDASFTFEILKPWYGTWLAFGLYALLLSMLTYLITKWRRAMHLEKETYRLESVVAERVKEIHWKNQQLEQQTIRLQEQSQKLAELDKVKSRFFANISHEFRTPLTLIMGSLEQILDNGWPGDTRGNKKLTLMLRNSQRLLRLIDQLLELSKLESGRVQLMTRPIDIVAYVKGTVSSFEPVASKNELELTVTAQQKKLMLLIDPVKIEIVLFNLLSNAIKFTPPGGQISVSIDPNTSPNMVPESVFIAVQDTGPGIPGEQMAHIFDRFYQSDSTFEYHQKGSGIGLAIAKELVELHNGTLEVESNEGEGSTFLIKLPMGKFKREIDGVTPTGLPSEMTVVQYPLEKNMARHLIEQSTERYQQQNNTVAGKERVLLVEDNADFRSYMKSALEPLYNVICATDGAEGIVKGKEVIPDLIISDIMMPKVDGFQLCRQLKSHRDTSHIPIILLTARASEESTEQGLEIGADDYITKPFSSRLLNARIRNLIEQRRRLQVERRTHLTKTPAPSEISSVDNRFYNELVQLLNQNISDPEFKVEQLRKKLFMGRTTLYRKIMALTGLSPNRFLRTYRLMRAAQLLKGKFGNVSEVASEVGFTNLAYFSQCFKEEFLTSPSHFNKKDIESPMDRN
jgi:signal transduction histidine kinase/DNA-binding response OmpR family regulator